MRVTLLNGLIGSAVGLGLLAPAAQAQHHHTGYHRYPKCDGKKTLPVFDSLYIKKFCGPTINPGTCFGFYPTRWTPWEQACPDGAGCEVPFPGAYPVADVPHLPPSPAAAQPHAAQAAPDERVPPTAPAEPAPKPAPKPAPATATPPRSDPLPLPNAAPNLPDRLPPAESVDRPDTETQAAPRPSASSAIRLKEPEVNVRYPGDLPVQPVVLPPGTRGSQ